MLVHHERKGEFEILLELGTILLQSATKSVKNRKTHTDMAKIERGLRNVFLDRFVASFAVFEKILILFKCRELSKGNSRMNRQRVLWILNSRKKGWMTRQKRRSQKVWQHELKVQLALEHLTSNIRRSRCQAEQDTLHLAGSASAGKIRCLASKSAIVF